MGSGRFIYKNWPQMSLEGRGKMSIKKILIGMLLLSLPMVAYADEVWESTRGRVVYETDLAATAIWSYRDKYHVGLIHIAGLAGIVENRDTYEAYWVQNHSDKKCASLRPTQNGGTSHYWGRIHIEFIGKTFPYEWKAKWSYCNDPMQKTLWEGKPATDF